MTFRDRQTVMAAIEAKLQALYGTDAAELFAWLQTRLGKIEPEPRRPLSERDAILITYGDHIHEGPGTGLKTLHSFAKTHLRGAFNTLHLLPHFPYSSDDGFSVIDYRAVEPDLGSWDDVQSMAQDFRLMFDAVINHISAKSEWFGDFLAGKHQDDFIAFSPDEVPEAALAQIYRPRATPLLTKFETQDGPKLVWTTFSPDQIDLNYASPHVAREIIDTLLFYTEQGARLLRLDAVGFLWKKVGTTSFHLPETHRFVQLLRDIFDVAQPDMVLVPEINGPLSENLPYLGNGHDEAQLIYHFTLPPLMLHTFGSEDAQRLKEWISSLRTPDGDVALFNFIASHDGLGVRAAAEVLDSTEFDTLLARAKASDAPINFRTAEDGTQVPYEINGTLYDLLNMPGTPEAEGISRMLCAHAVLLSLQGVPGIYMHSLFGTPSWREGWRKTQHHRTLNRRKLHISEVHSQILDPDSRAAQLLKGLTALLEERCQRPAFSPQATQRVLDAPPEVFALARGVGPETVYCIHNVSGRDVSYELPEAIAPFASRGGAVITGRQCSLPGLSYVWGYVSSR